VFDFGQADSGLGVVWLEQSVAYIELSPHVGVVARKPASSHQSAHIGKARWCSDRKTASSRQAVAVIINYLLVRARKGWWCTFPVGLEVQRHLKRIAQALTRGSPE